jgi:phosphate transport system substrate-binding protein
MMRVRVWLSAIVVFAGSPSLFGQDRGKIIKVDGSSTVAPIATAAAEMFQAEHPDIHVTVGISGTGGGFKKFLTDKPELRTDISDASRPIKESEAELASKLGVEFIEIPVAIDGLAIIAHPKNKFCDDLTVAELKRIWEPGSTINNWNQVRAGFPDQPLRLYGPGTDSGTFDYFTEAIVGKEKASRSDYTASESDNVLVMGVAGDEGALGYFGFSYYEANKAKLKLLGVDKGDGRPVKPSLEIVRGGGYEPLARPLFIYVNRTAADRPEVQAFVQYVLENGQKIVEHPRVNYVALEPEIYGLAKKRFESRTTGSAMAAAKGGEKRGLKAIFGG